MSRIAPTYILLLSLATLYGSSSVVGGTSAKSIVAFRTTSAPHIDGLLSEQAWQSAVPGESFQQFDPEEGAAATERTAVIVLYDDNALYIGVHCYDSHPEAITTQLSRRD